MAKKSFLKGVLIFFLIICLITAGIIIYLKFFWKDILREILIKKTGFRIQYEDVIINKEKDTVNFKGLVVFEKRNYFKQLLYAKDCVLVLNGDIFKLKAKTRINQITINQAKLNIERNKKGKLNLALNNNCRGERPFAPTYAYAQDESNLYKFSKQIKKLTINNSIIMFKDYCINPNFQKNFYDVNFSFDTQEEPSSNFNFIPIKCLLNFRIDNTTKNDSKVSSKIDLRSYTDRTDISMTINTYGMDVMEFKQYFQRYSPYTFRNGLFSSTTYLNISNNNIDSLTTIYFHRLNVLLDDKLQNVPFLDISANKLIPYLTTQSGDVVFDFKIVGPINRPRASLGPQVKNAITMATIEQVGRLIQTIQQYTR